MSFSDRLKELLYKNDMKAADLARACGVSAAAISDYVNGKKEPRSQQSIAIARAFGISLDTLWKTGLGDDSDKIEEPKIEIVEVPIIDEITQKYNLLNDESKKVIDSLINQLLQVQEKQTNINNSENNSSVQEDIQNKISSILNGNIQENFEINKNLNTNQSRILLNNLTILAKRKKKDLTNILTELGIYTSFISRLEKNGSVFSEEVLKLAAYFNISANYLINNKIIDHIKTDYASNDENCLILLGKNGNNEKFQLDATKQERIKTVLKASFPEIFDDAVD